MADEHDDDIEPEVDESDVETVHYGDVTDDDVTDDAEGEEDADGVKDPDADEDDDAIDDDAPDSM